jgi:uncharacterized protein YodC (DUF2158 family)
MSYLKMMQKVRGDLHESGLLQVGELVRLKSGGPVMTVEEMDGEGRIICVWTGVGGFSREAFKGELLKRYEGGLRRWAS